jgi:predicted ATP-dependent protease
MAVSALSALEGVAVRQDTVLIGALTVGGELRGVRGVTQQIESAVDVGYARAVVPEANRNDVLLNPLYKDRVALVYAKTLTDALEDVLVGPRRDDVLEGLRQLAKPRNGHLKRKAAEPVVARR